MFLIPILFFSERISASIFRRFDFDSTLICECPNKNIVARFRTFEELPRSLQTELALAFQVISSDSWRERKVRDPYSNLEYCLYFFLFLFHGSDKPQQIYIGQTCNFKERRNQHLQNMTISKSETAYALVTAETRREAKRLEALWINAFRCFPADFRLNNKIIPPLRTRQKNKNGPPIEFIKENFIVG